jgi:aryl-alcohol dehydrogenase-like predicted oxidoreductase
MHMKYRRLGNSGLLVSELGLGTMTFGEDSGRGVPAAEARHLIEMYLDAGGNHLDTADVYAGGRAEEIVGEAIRDVRDRIVLATKVRWPMGQGPNDAGLSRHHILSGLEASLRRLRTDAVDVLYLHGWDPWTPLQESMSALADLVRSGKVRYIAVSNFKAWQVMKALALSDLRGWPRFIAAQYQYSLVSRGIEQELTELFAAEGIGLVPWGPLGGGFLTGRYRRGERPNGAAAGRLATAPDDWEESWARRATDQNWAARCRKWRLAGSWRNPRFRRWWLAREPRRSSPTISAPPLGSSPGTILRPSARPRANRRAIPTGLPVRTSADCAELPRGQCTPEEAMSAANWPRADIFYRTGDRFAPPPDLRRVWRWHAHAVTPRMPKRARYSRGVAPV